LDRDVITTYFRRLPLPDLVVLVQAPLRQCLERVRARGLPSRLKDKNQTTVDEFLDKAGQIVQLASSYLSSSGCPMIQIDNDGLLEDSATTLDERLDTYFRHVSNTRPSPRKTADQENDITVGRARQ
jgi:thymidylate kinase